MYRIGEFSQMSKTTIKTLRYYDEEGLLKPEATDKFTGYRLYTTNQLLLIHRIQSMRQLGLSVNEVKQILSGSVDVSTVLEKRKAEILAELSYTQDQLSRIEFILSGQEEETYMCYQAIIKELPERIIYSVEAVIPDYKAYFDLIPAVGEKVSKKYPDLKCSAPDYCYVRYLDGEYKEKDIRIEICEAVDKLKEDFDDVKFGTIKPVSAVSIMHKGPYSTIGKAYAFAMKWVEENKYTIIDCPRESYIDGIWNKENEEDWLTEIQIPVELKNPA